VNTREWHKICLKLVQVDVEGTIKTQAGGNRANDLGHKTVEMVISRARDVQVTLTYIVDSLIVNEERAVRVVNGAMCRQDGVVWFHHGSRHARGRVNHKL
jgi:hypothetical protein